MMDEFERHVRAYRTQTTASASAKRSLLMDVQRIRDPRLVPFLLGVMADRREPDDVRVHVLKALRNGDRLVCAADRPRVAQAIGDLLVSDSSEELRLQAVLALGEFVQVDGVLPRLNTVCLAPGESIDLRYAAFTSLERAGPTVECIALLRQMTGDDTLGQSARSVLSVWHVDEASRKQPS
jgi:hypothetical protein